MGNIGDLTGEPWHIERMVRNEGDARRHRSRCIYYSGKEDHYCFHYSERCFGSAHCKGYVERQCKKIEQEDLLQKKKFAQKQLVPEKKIVSFDDVRLIDMKDISIPKHFTKMPSEKHMNQVEKYYLEHNAFDKPIVVMLGKNGYVLKDRYVRYCLAKKYGLHQIYAEMGTDEEIKNWDSLRHLGTLVWNKREEVGEVINFTIKYVTIKYDSGKEIMYDIHKCLKDMRIL